MIKNLTRGQTHIAPPNIVNSLKKLYQNQVMVWKEISRTAKFRNAVLYDLDEK